MVHQQKIWSLILSLFFFLCLPPLIALADEEAAASASDEVCLPSSDIEDAIDLGEEDTADLGEELLLIDGAAIIDLPCGKNMTCTLDENGVLTIRGTGETYSSTSDLSTYYESNPSAALPWIFYGRKQDIRTVVLEEGVTRIGGGAFELCSNLTSISFPSTLRAIDGDAFRGCHGLESIEIPDSVQEIGGGAFKQCGNLKSITLPSDVKLVGEGIFQGCSSLTSIELPENMECIERDTFSGCSSLQTIVIPDTVKSIRSRAFCSCQNLTDVVIPEGVQEIGEGAFLACLNLKSIHLPSTLQRIDDSAFNDSVQDIYYAASVKEWNSIQFGINAVNRVTTVHFAAEPVYDPLPFEDVADQWFAPSVRFVYENGLFKGTSADTFSPNAKMTRGMFITVLDRFASGSLISAPREMWSGILGYVDAPNVCVLTDTTGLPTFSREVGVTGKGGSVTVLEQVPQGEDGGVWYKVHFNGKEGYIREKLYDDTYNFYRTQLKVYTGGFQDLPDGAYYTGHAQWAYIHGIMNGVSATEFQPGRNIRREDICVLLYRYLTLCCGMVFDTPGSAFTDDDAISAYARDAVYAMRSAGIVNGYPDNSFRPKAYASRAEVAKMFENLHTFLDTSLG